MRVAVHLVVCPCVWVYVYVSVCLCKMFDFACAKPTLQDAEIMFDLLESGDSTQASVTLIQEPLPTVTCLYGRLLSSAALSTGVFASVCTAVCHSHRHRTCSSQSGFL